jgi:hypothetical protein
MILVEFPPHNFKVREEDGKEFIFDELRKVWLRLTGEEWVRQNFLQYLVQVKQYPASLVAVEREITLGELKKRFDILVFDRQHRPWLMVECKGAGIPLTEGVLDQVLRYNMAVPVEYMIITNGSYSAGFHRSNGQLQQISELPAFV